MDFFAVNYLNAQCLHKVNLEIWKKNKTGNYFCVRFSYVDERSIECQLSF